MIDQAFILAAGFGTRLRPLTEALPKPLFPVASRPLLGLLLDHLAALGIERVGINAHHLAGMIAAFAEARTGPPGVVLYFEEDEIKGTGGGLGQAWANFSNGPLLVINGDVFFDFDLTEIMAAHERSGAAVSMVLHDRPGLNQVLVEGERVVGFRDDASPGGSGEVRRLAYTCVQVVEREAFRYLPRREAGGLIDAYRNLIADGGLIRAHVLEGGHYWADIGSPAGYLGLHRDLLTGGRSGFGFSPRGPVSTAEGARVEDGAATDGFVSLSPGAVVEAGAEVRDVVLMEGAVIKSGARVSRSVLGPGARAQGRVDDGVLIAS